MDKENQKLKKEFVEVDENTLKTIEDEYDLRSIAYLQIKLKFDKQSIPKTLVEFDTSRIKSLCLQDNSIQSIESLGFIDTRNLQSIELFRNKITQTSVLGKINCVNFLKIMIFGNPISELSFERMRVNANSYLLLEGRPHYDPICQDLNKLFKIFANPSNGKGTYNYSGCKRIKQPRFHQIAQELSKFHHK